MLRGKGNSVPVELPDYPRTIAKILLTLDNLVKLKELEKLPCSKIRLLSVN